MAKLSEIWDSYKDYSAVLSQIARPLGFGAAGVAWVLRGDNFEFAPPVKASLLLTVGYFSADLLQYYIAAATVGLWARRTEKVLWQSTGSIDGEVDRPRWLDLPGRILWHLKVLLLLTAFGSLGIHVL